MKFPEVFHPSPNHDAKTKHERRGVCFHHTVLSLADTVTRMTDPASRVSYHLVIGPEGQRVRLVADVAVAWHAGISRWAGREGCNAFLLGLAFAGNTYDRPLATAQLESAREWLAARWRRYAWSLEMMTDHRQVAPGRKDDLNPTEWTRVVELLRTLQR